MVSAVHVIGLFWVDIGFRHLIEAQVVITCLMSIYIYVAYVMILYSYKIKLCNICLFCCIVSLLWWTY